MLDELKMRKNKIEGAIANAGRKSEIETDLPLVKVGIKISQAAVDILSTKKNKSHFIDKIIKKSLES